MQFCVLPLKSSLVPRGDPYWAHRLHSLWLLEVQVSRARLVLLGIVGPIFPVQHHSPGAGTIGLGGSLAWRGSKVRVAGVNRATGSLGSSSHHDRLRLAWAG